jgi:hypothetical protein
LLQTTVVTVDALLVGRTTSGTAQRVGARLDQLADHNERRAAT